MADETETTTEGLIAAFTLEERGLEAVVQHMRDLEDFKEQASAVLKAHATALPGLAENSSKYRKVRELYTKEREKQTRYTGDDQYIALEGFLDELEEAMSS